MTGGIGVDPDQGSEKPGKLLENMDQKILKYALADVPRYTSYPTAPHFHNDITADDYAAWLGALKEGDTLSLYVHIPFCHQLCWYCGCHTSVPNTYDRAERYQNTLIGEMALVAAAMNSSPQVTHIHFGGGTPTYLKEDDLEKIMVSIRDHFNIAPDAEIAIEIDPRTLTEEKIDILVKTGFNRVSLGVQDFSPHVQANINRHQPYGLVKQRVEWLRQAGLTDISFDLMYGLPGQSVSDAVLSANMALDLEPKRLSVFGYAHVPWFKKHQNMIDEADLPGVKARLAQSGYIARTLIKRGYEEIGFDHYAKPDDPLAISLKDGTIRRNFQGYTTDTAKALIGLGASSIGSFENGYVQNAPDTKSYRDLVESGTLPVARGTSLTKDDRVRKEAIERVMCQMSLDLAELESSFDLAPDYWDKSLEVLAPLQEDGLIEIEDRKISVTTCGKRFVRNVAVAFDAYADAKAAKHSKAV